MCLCVCVLATSHRILKHTATVASFCAPLGGALGVANTVGVHDRVNVLSINVKEVTESLAAFGVGTVSADSKGSPEVRGPQKSLQSISRAFGCY